MRVVNNHSRPLSLEDGTILAAAGTNGSMREVTLSDRDRARLVDRGYVSIVEDDVGAVSGQQSAVSQNGGSDAAGAVGGKDTAKPDGGGSAAAKTKKGGDS